MKMNIKPKYVLAIFDMDGTILNTLEDLWIATNYALALHQMPERTFEEVRQFVGNGIANLIKKAVPEGTDEALEKLVLQDFTAYYNDHSMDRTRPYEGIVELIKELKKQGMKTAVVSNKIDGAVQKLCQSLFADCFDMAVGERESLRRKPAPDMVEYVMEEMNVSASQAVYIGDSEVDIATAKASNLPCIAVEWGFRKRNELPQTEDVCFVANTDELQKCLLLCE